jgi:hypothetical protein
VRRVFGVVHAAFNLRVELSDGNALGEFSYLPIAYFNKRQPSCGEDPCESAVGWSRCFVQKF